MASNNSTTLPPKLIESVQTVAPLRPTYPRRMRLLTIKEDLGSEIFRRWFHVVQYHKKVSQDDSGWLLAGRIKESLGAALLEQPIFAGRLQRRRDGCDEKFKIVPNDCGVRFYEAQMAVNLDDFLNSEAREEGEAQLVHWDDIDEINPQFCPLSFVQVTNFKCGGYSFGFSCNILVEDPFTITSFLHQWANIHKTIVTNAKIPKVPLFCLPITGKTDPPPPHPQYQNDLVLKRNNSKTCTIQVTLESLNLEQPAELKEFAALCIEEAAKKVGAAKLPASFSLYVKPRYEEIKVETVSRNFGVMNPKCILSGLSWEGDDFGTHEICFNEANRRIRVTSWINSVEVDEGLVMVIPYCNEGISGIKIVVTLPNEKVN